MEHENWRVGSSTYSISLKAEGGTNSVNRKCDPLRRSCTLRERNAGESAICPVCARPSAEIARVERAKCSACRVREKSRRECDLSGVRAKLCGDHASHARATLCGDRAGRVREMQARVRFVWCARSPPRRSCGSSARNAGESAIYPIRAQPSAETVRVQCAKSRREGDLSHARAYLGSWKMRTGDLVVQL